MNGISLLEALNMRQRELNLCKLGFVFCKREQNQVKYK